MSHYGLQLQLSFIYVDIDADGNKIQRVRKTAPPIKVEIVPISAWSDIVPDEALTVIDKRIIKTEAQIKALNELAESLANSNGNGNGGNCDCEDGVPVVDFNECTDFVTPDDDVNSEQLDNVVEF